MKSRKIAIVGAGSTALSAAITTILATKGVNQSDLCFVDTDKEDYKDSLKKIAEEHVDKYEPKKLYSDELRFPKRELKKGKLEKEHPFQKFMGKKKW